MEHSLEIFLKKVEHIPQYRMFGRVTTLKGLLIECAGLAEMVSIGSRCKIIARDGRHIIAEVIGFKDSTTLLMPFTEVDAVGVGCKVMFMESQSLISPDDSWLGRVINAAGEPIDDKGPIKRGDKAYPFRNNPPPAHKRKRVGGKVDVGVKSINTFLSCCYGQRMGIFAGSGVGKSMLIAMLTRYAHTDVKVIGLIGERGREVQEFLHEYLGEEGLKSAVVIVATGDESALMRRQAAYLTMSVAEYFRDTGREVLCLMDSVTRFAMAQREIGLSAGEPPTAKGYTPTVFSELPKLLERAGPGMEGQGNITGLFSVLVDGDDHNEPIADAVRGILDGHIVLDRSIAERGRFPAINILRSISRTMPGCNSDKENALVMRGRQLLATYNDMAEMIRLGAYRKGSDPEVDTAIRYYPAIEAYLTQAPNESRDLPDCYKDLAIVLDVPDFESLSG